MKRILFGYTCAVLFMLVAIQATLADDQKKAGPYDVAIDNFSFIPQTLTVPAGTKVTWVNHDDSVHTVLSNDKTTIVSPALDTDDRFSFTFTAAGTNDYYCSVHPHMKGRIIVQ